MKEKIIHIFFKKYKISGNYDKLLGEYEDINFENKKKEISGVNQEINNIMGFNNQDMFRIIELITQFQPVRSWEREEGYHKNSLGYLQAYYPNIKYEFQEGSSRPDLVINNIAIEIKGPTYSKDLDTIASKCLRYSQKFNGLIIVLFDSHVTSRYFEEWKLGMKKHFPSVIVMEK